MAIVRATILVLLFLIAASEALLSVFEKGYLETKTITVRTHSLFIVSPRRTGRYPVLLFFHGTSLQNDFYSDVFEHVASHGYIVVAPQLYWLLPPQQTKEIEKAATVANWLPSNLQTVLPEGVEGDLTRLAVSGHSRGGKTAFALALGKSETQLQVNISALIGVDPVAGTSKECRTKPYILTYEPNSFDLSIPVSVIGTGLGNHSRFLVGPACAPNEVSHVEFYNECKAECTHFVIADYGHMDMLNYDVIFTPLGVVARSMCVNGKGNDELMRKTLGGLIVAFLDAYLLEEGAEFDSILANPSVAPTKLYPVQAKTLEEEQGHAQI